jgi:deazaflavin-dependent oxidoreductase (nitroreductase family)
MMPLPALLVVVVAVHVAVAAVIAAVIVRRRPGDPHRDAGAPRPESRHGGHANGLLGVVSRTVAALVGMGMHLGPVRLLTVRGRTSGIPRSTPVDAFTDAGGDLWLVATHTARAQWVRNLRAVGEGRLSRGREDVPFTARELPADEGAVILARVVAPRLARPWGGFVLRRTLGLPAHPDAGQLAEAVREHPVFALASHPDPASVPERARDRRFLPRHLIGIGVVVAFAHALAGAAGVLGPMGWMAGVAIGLLVAGLGNHLRLATGSI